MSVLQLCQSCANNKSILVASFCAIYSLRMGAGVVKVWRVVRQQSGQD